ncbi:hypothetical protein A5821_002599 [Enterococcus sp. 7F3_DIV0205]|uniref:ASCH domain-containing protein n=1 Tax=Candidatus Enterococcus palustris TaxID=1834189 RepID=A0AAQ3WBA9_9ENTE|nr:ASCH domain-containing protein [Enterococcus sp. 7F3_DIV0205]OTN83030.1 hypothetical protein A5821_002953 [Enterococcus sp. 7F3_DIV0205]
MGHKVIKFGEKENEQDQLANLVDSGIKVATSSLLYLQEIGVKESTKVGDKWIIQDSQNRKVCEVKVEEVTITTFASITNDFAIKEGDQSFQNWYDIHWKYYTNLLSKYNQEMTDTTKLECVYFKKVD